jgi:hypothetical protein
MGYSECPTSGAFRPRQTLAVDRAHKERPKYSHWTREWGNLVFFLNSVGRKKLLQRSRRPRSLIASASWGKLAKNPS